MRTVIGIDYGTQSARAVLVDAATGQVLCSHSIAYPHGVMDKTLPDGTVRVAPSRYTTAEEWQKLLQIIYKIS